jgi:DNA-binding transcriptional LysR family regulator
MELRHLRYFVAVAEELNFRWAAEGVFVAQGAVSAQARNLDRDLGVGLLDRTPPTVSFTEASGVWLTKACRVLHRAEVAPLAAVNPRSRSTSSPRIGYTPAALPAIVPRALSASAEALRRADHDRLSDRAEADRR